MKMAPTASKPTVDEFLDMDFSYTQPKYPSIPTINGIGSLLVAMGMDATHPKLCYNNVKQKFMKKILRKLGLDISLAHYERTDYVVHGELDCLVIPKNWTLEQIRERMIEFYKLDPAKCAPLPPPTPASTPKQTPTNDAITSNDNAITSNDTAITSNDNAIAGNNNDKPATTTWTDTGVIGTAAGLGSLMLALKIPVTDPNLSCPDTRLAYLAAILELLGFDHRNATDRCFRRLDKIRFNSTDTFAQTRASVAMFFGLEIDAANAKDTEEPEPNKYLQLAKKKQAENKKRLEEVKQKAAAAAAAAATKAKKPAASKTTKTTKTTKKKTVGRPKKDESDTESENEEEEQVQEDESDEEESLVADSDSEDELAMTTTSTKRKRRGTPSPGKVKANYRTPVKDSHGMVAISKEKYEELVGFKKSYYTLEETHQELKEKVEKQTTGIEVNPALINTALIMPVKKALKKKIFRNIQFVKTDEGLIQITKMVWQFVKVTPNLPRKEFGIHYRHVVRKALNEQRHYTTQEAKKMARCTCDFVFITCFLVVVMRYLVIVTRFLLHTYEFCCLLRVIFQTDYYHEHKTLPTVEEILALYKTPVEELEKLPQDDPKIQMLVFWYDKYLEKIVLPDYWGPKIRVNHLFTDTFDLKGRTEMYVGKIWMTTNAEAFALVALENHREGWMAAFEMEAEDPEWECPRSGPEAKPFQGKFSRPDSGSMLFGGWSEEGLDRYEELEKELVEFRETEAVTSKAYPEFIKKLMRLANPKLCKEATPNNGSAKKRKTEKAAVKELAFKFT